MLATSEESTDLLRKELHRLLQDLDEEIKTSYPTSSCELAKRVAVAEFSAVQDMADLSRRALTGSGLQGDPRCTTATQALDLRDSLAIAARDVRIERERVEAELSSLQLLNWPQEFLESLQEHLAQEGLVCTDQEQAAQRGRQRAAALRAVIKDVTDCILDCLACASRLPGEAQQRRVLGLQALEKVEQAVSGWLRWTSKLDEVEAQLAARCPPLKIARVLIDVSARDAKAASFLSTVRKTMKLRRQQLRLQGSQQRLVAVLAAGEALASLQARIRLV